MKRHSLSFDVDHKQQGMFTKGSTCSSTTTSSSTPRNTVQHKYHDHSGDQVDEVTLSKQIFAKGGIAAPFPIKLHQMLKCIEDDGHSDIVRWAPHGRAFVVHKPKEFAHLLLRQYFSMTKFASFQRQLNLYGFNRLTRGPDKGGYYHSYFLRSKPLLAHKIQRFKVKGTQVRQRSNPDLEPNFYKMEPVGEGTQGEVRIAHPLSVPSSSSVTPKKTESISEPQVFTWEPIACPSTTMPRKQGSFDDFSSTFGRDFHDVSTDQFIKRYNKEEGCTSSIAREVGKSISLTKPNLEHIDDSLFVTDEDFGSLLEDIVDV